MLIAVEGCAHGELDQIYSAIQNLEKERNVQVDLLICCGDFQAVRNHADLQCMAVPNKFKHMCSFYKYYSGEAKAPLLTIFVGGNHEASNYLQELAYGGWVAPNIYYLGYAGVVKIGGIRIAGISGIYKGHDYLRGHFEKPPYDPGTMRSAYHVRNLEVFRLRQLKGDIDIFISHDWPRGVYNYGDVDELLRFKPYFRGEVASNTLGSQAGETLLHELKPKHWFSAHLHVKFCATIKHDEQRATQFMALDKCLPRRKYLELVTIPHDPDEPLRLCYDPHWLAILKSTNHLLSVSPAPSYMPGPGSNSDERWDFHPTEEELVSVNDLLGGDYSIPENFKITTETHDPRNQRRVFRQPEARINPQTSEFCRKLGVDDPLEKLLGPKAPPPEPVPNPDEIAIDDEEEADESDQCVSSNNPDDLFFIDTQPKRSKLMLPEPQKAESEASRDFGQPTKDERSQKESNRVPSPETEKPTEEPSSGEPPVARQMKRRNQNVYSINPEDY